MELPRDTQFPGPPKVEPAKPFDLDAALGRTPIKNGDVIRVRERITVPPLDNAPETKDERYIGGTHYKDMDIEPWDVVDTWPRDQRIGFYRGGALKYIMRMGAKDQSAKEIAKGQAYVRKLLAILEEPTNG